MTADVLERLKLEETARANRAKEDISRQQNLLKEHENLAKYGMYNYVTSDMPLGAEEAKPQKFLMGLSDTLELLGNILNPLAAFSKKGR